ncbi:MAG: hypothetical protein IJL76_02615 [Bacilli bacterium]|nr:hypothetical protein [Bacilli bacterium]
MENNGVMICPKCGNEMHYNDRFCFHCGYINYDNSSNDFLVKYDKKAKKKLKKEGKEEPTNKFFNFDLRKKDTTKEKKYYKSVDDYKETVSKHVEKTKFEKTHSLFESIYRLIIFVLFVVVVFYGYKFLVGKQQVYVDHSKEIVNKIKYKYGNNNFKKCNKSDEYLFVFSSDTLKKDFNLDIVSPYLKNQYKGYVLVTKVNGKYQYSIALSDGTFGIREKNIDELKPSNVLPYYKINYPSINTNCK